MKKYTSLTGLALLTLPFLPSQLAWSAGPDAAQWRLDDPGVRERLAKLQAATQQMIASHGEQWQRNAGLDQPPRIWRVPGAIEELWDASYAPRMKIIPAGEYTMGWTEADPMIFASTPKPPPGAMTRHRVRIAYPFALSRHPVSVVRTF